MHNCPKCGKPTSGEYGGGGLKWAICDDCMHAQIQDVERERAMRSKLKWKYRSRKEVNKI